MKNFGAIIFLLATAGSFVAGTPAFSHEKKALLAKPVDISARALELVPRLKAGSKASNETDNEARSLVGPRGANSSSDAETESKARSLVVPRSANSTDENAARSLHLSTPKLRRGAHACNETDA
ncbi:hypothetical protein GGS26DRAFT_596724 [Hypomontagnella submonticulosa]|nr:hypothetical protein GGS26DRAFT_596724 [Hypomontagnella submonticulosa]